MHEYYMSLALKEAKRAFTLDEVPVGAVIVKNNIVISKGHNVRETMKSALAHAETIAIEEACTTLGGWRLLDCDLYVTLEPCPMCAGAAVNARINRIIFGACDKRAGACGSVYNIANDERLNHRIEVIPGILEEECRELLQEFFKRKRK